jgi:uncharacterized protein (DUF1697 family)
MNGTYLALLRGVNVGGRNRVPMAALRTLLEDLGQLRVSTYIASGNVILESRSQADEIQAQIEQALPKAFSLDAELVRVLILSADQLEAVVSKKPANFGEDPGKYHSDAIFLMGIGVEEAMQIFDPREGVDTVWPGDGVIYSQRLSALRTRSRLSKIMGTPAYRSMTIRSWQTTTTLLDLVHERQQAPGS